MDYKPLIAKAIQKNNISRYKLAQRLGYKRESAIYQVENGKAGMSAARLIRLAELAGMTLKAIAILAFTLAALPMGETRAENERSPLNQTIHYAKWLTLARKFLRLRSIIGYAPCHA